MLFNSFWYLLFFPIVFFVYWFVLKKNFRAQNLFLLAASYFFYGCWDWRFLLLLAFSTFLDYFSGLMIEQQQSQRRKRFWMWLSIILNLGFLGIFKYYNFFIESFADLSASVGINFHPYLLQIILPVGISFYTFHGLSYVIDLYYGKIKAEKNVVSYSLFVSFFPLLVAGPIERATHLLPQITHKRHFDFDKAMNGLRQILWGLFKKMVIADNCAEYVDMAFQADAGHSGWVLVLGAVLFAVQIYGDFSGYSDIALGSARLLGFELLKNFSFPYFSRNIAEFWKRWHISLSSWFRDYLYIPLGGNRGSKFFVARNTFIVFLVSGFWHGANWTFIVWGALHGFFYLFLQLTNRSKLNSVVVAEKRLLPSFKELFQMLLTFALVTLAWIFFRADSLSHAYHYIIDLFTGLTKANSLHELQMVLQWKHNYSYVLFFFLTVLFGVEWLGRNRSFALEDFDKRWKGLLRWTLYLFLVMAIFWFSGKDQQFIYFQF